MPSHQPKDELKVPAPDDLAGWTATNRRLSKRIVESVSAKQLTASRAVKQYFGADDLAYFLEEYHALGIVQSYVVWAILDFRPNRKAKTRAQHMLDEGLPPAETMLLGALMQSHPTLYRVVAHDPKAGTVDLADVLLGGSVTVHDRLMSEHIEDGQFVTARTFVAGDFHFLELAGPLLGRAMGIDAVDFLRFCGMEFTRDGLRRDAHKFGWLWAWSDEKQRNQQPPHLVNMDGDDMLWHTASFRVHDPGAARAALLARRDIVRDEEQDEFVWSVEKGKAADTMGGPVTLGRIELVGDELILSCNSAQRFAAGRQWIETLPGAGVSFRGVTTRTVDDLMQKDGPLDERIADPEPVEMTPDLLVGVQAMMDKYYRAWLDTPLPVLAGLTPRQACETPAGRQQVTMVIRTAPDPTGPAPVRMPRQALLRELGLADESMPTGNPAPPDLPPALLPDIPLDVPLDHPPMAPFASAKIGRNEPCPCGSGRKYKKCCAR